MSDYTPSGAPVTSSSGSSSAIRAEFALIQTAIASKADSAGPTLTTPALGAATATSINKITLTQPATGATLTLTDGKTLSVAKTLTLTGTDGTTMTFPATSASVARIDAAQTFTGIQDFDGRIDANAGLAVTGANFTSRGITDSATAAALTLSGSGANSVTIANSATNPTIGTSAGSLDFNPVGQGISLRVSTGGASTVNSLQVAGGTTGNRITVLANGSDTNVGASWQTKGSGTHLFVTETGASAQVEIQHTASATRYLTLTGSNGGNPTIGTSAGDLAIASATGFMRNTASASSIIYSIGTTGSGAFVAQGAAGQAAAYQMIVDGAETARIVSSSNGMGLSTGPSATVQVSIAHTASANRYLTLTGSNGGNPTIGTSAGALNIASGAGNVAINAGAAALNAALSVTCTGVSGCAIQLVGNGATTPNKFIRSFSGNLEIVDSGFAAAIVQISDAGSIAANTATAIPAGGTAGVGLKVSSTANFGVFFGSGAPSLSAAKGSIYLRSDGSTTNNRMYVNTDGATTWTAVTTAA